MSATSANHRRGCSLEMMMLNSLAPGTSLVCTGSSPLYAAGTSQVSTRTVRYFQFVLKHDSILVSRLVRCLIVKLCVLIACTFEAKSHSAWFAALDWTSRSYLLECADML